MTFNVFSFFFLSILTCIFSSLLIHHLVFLIIFLIPLLLYLHFSFILILVRTIRFFIFMFFSSIPYTFPISSSLWILHLVFYSFLFLQSYIFIFNHPYSCSFSSRFLFVLFFMCIFYYFFFFCFCSPTFLIFTTSISHSSLFYLKLHLSLAFYPPLSLTPHFIHHYCLPSPSSSFISHSFHSPFHHFS